VGNREHTYTSPHPYTSKYLQKMAEVLRTQWLERLKRESENKAGVGSVDDAARILRADVKIGIEAREVGVIAGQV